jgi:hypothetical protein
MSTRELDWFTSSYSNANNGECVEVAAAGAAMAVRDSKDRAGGRLEVRATSWRAFLALVPVIAGV